MTTARPANLSDRIFRDLQAQILSGRLGPGSRLQPERELATEYGTNRNTLREAVRKLEQSGLVSVRHGQGVTVADFAELVEPMGRHLAQRTTLYGPVEEATSV